MGQLPEFVKSDGQLKDRFSVGFYGYFTSVGWPILSAIRDTILFWRSRPAKIQTLAEGLKTEIDITYKAHDEVVLVGHSLGGLVARRYLIEEAKKKGNSPLRVKKLALYASPNNGAHLARVAKCFSWTNKQLKQLCKNADIIQSINEDWHTLGIGGRIKTAYIRGGQDKVVDEVSAKGFWGNPNVYTIVDAGHMDIVKPTSDKGLRFTVLRNLLLDDT